MTPLLIAVSFPALAVLFAHRQERTPSQRQIDALARRDRRRSHA